MGIIEETVIIPRGGSGSGITSTNNMGGKTKIIDIFGKLVGFKQKESRSQSTSIECVVFGGPPCLPHNLNKQRKNNIKQLVGIK